MEITNKEIILITSEDLVSSYQEIFKNKHHFQIISTGEANPENTSHRLIQLAEQNNFLEFQQNLPSKTIELDAKKLMNAVRVKLGLEVSNIVQDYDIIRDLYKNNQLFLIGECVEIKKSVYQIIDRRANYLVVADASGKISRKWLKDCLPTDEMPKDIEKINYQQRLLEYTK